MDAHRLGGNSGFGARVRPPRLWGALLPLILAALYACGGSDAVTDGQYEVQGQACAADITSTSPSGVTKVYLNQPIPWSFAFTFEAKTIGTLTLTATNHCGWGQLTAYIYIDGVRKQSRSCSTPYCSMTLMQTP